MGKYNYSGLEKNRGGLDKKRELGLPILNRWSNHTQLLTNGRAISMRFTLFKLFLLKSKSIDLAFLLANLLLFPNYFYWFLISHIFFEEFSSNPFKSIISSLLSSLYSPVGTSSLIFIILTRFNDRTLYPKASHILLI